MPPDGAATAAVRPRLVQRSRRLLSRWLRPALDPGAPTGLLTGRQLATLRAFLEVLVGMPALEEADWAPIRGAIAIAARERPGYRALCVSGCRVLDALGADRFADAAPAERVRLVEEARLAVRPVTPRELLVPGRRAQHEVRELLVPELIRAFFDSPAGWAVVGYTEPLGACRDPFAYARSPS